MIKALLIAALLASLILFTQCQFQFRGAMMIGDKVISINVGTTVQKLLQITPEKAKLQT